MFSITDFFASSDQPKSLGAKFRNARLKDFEALFFKRFAGNKKIRILDVGGTDYFWRTSKIPDLKGVEITLLNLHLEDSTHPHITGIVGDATSMSEIPNDHFDLVFSNSVIEHVYTFKNQQKMAQEILRVGHYYFIQTPNRYFPVEAHYAIPFAQYLPKPWVYFFLTKTKMSRLQKWDPKDAKQYLDEIRLLNEKEMRELFPKCAIYKENLIGMTKSITAHNLV